MDAPALNLTPVLQHLFKGHGIDGTIDGEWLILPRPHTRASAAIVQETPHSGSLVVVQLDVKVFVGFGRVIVESFAGFGGDREEAVRDAVNAFVDGAFHAIVASCFGVETDQAERERWTIGGTERTVTLGPAQCRGMGQQPLQFDVGWFEQLKATIIRHAVPPGTHWVRLYVSHSDRKLTECEVLLDNDPWPAVQADATRIDWPQVDGFASHRIFLILRGGGHDVAEVGGLIHELRDGDDDAIEDELVRRGLAFRDAQLAVVLIPLAFGRVALKTLVRQFPDELILIAPEDGGRQSLRLSTDPVFIQATNLAQDAADHGTLTQEQFSALALRGPEVQAVNNALNAGEEAADLVLSSPIMTFRADATTSAPARESGAIPVPSESETRQKPWWRFWA